MWEELGIPETTDAKSIRKAYAARLKVLHRAGDDPAFARLHAAYQQALAWAARSARATETPSEVVYLKPAPPPAEPPTPDDVAFQAMGARIATFLQEEKFQDAIGAYDQGLARGILPLGSDGPYLDQIMDMAVRTLASEPFMALMHRVGWTNPPRFRGWYTPVRQAADHRLEAENWYRNIQKEAAGDGKRPPVRATSVLNRIQQALQRRYRRRNARLLLIDRRQLIRVNKATVQDLEGKMAFYQRYQSWLAPRFPEHAIARAQWMLDLDTTWGQILRRAAGWISLLAILSGISGEWGTGAAVKSIYAISVIVLVLSGLMAFYRRLKNFKPAWAAWLSGKGAMLFGKAIYAVVVAITFFKLMGWIAGWNDPVGGSLIIWTYVALGLTGFVFKKRKQGRR